MRKEERRQQEKEGRQQDIIDAAERVFFLKGYENSSMDEVAKEAEFSKRTIYVYFNSKEQIYFEIMIRGYRLLIEKIENGLQKTQPQNALDELRCIFFTFWEFSQSNPAYFKAIMEYETKNSEDKPGTPDKSRAECYRLGEQIFGYLSRALKKGVAEGSLQEGMDSELAALLLWACTIGIYNTGEKKGDYLKKYHLVDSKEFISDSFRFMIRLIGTKGAKQDEKGV